MASISFAITACNEHVELKRLLDQTLKELQQAQDELTLAIEALVRARAIKP